MADENKEQPFIQPKGTEGLTFKGFDKPEEKSAEEKPPAGTGEGEEKEEVLTLEEMKQRFPKLKIKFSVAGEEKILAPVELGEHYQLTSGREKTIEQRNTESVRLQEEIRRLHADALEIRGTAKAKVEEKPPDLDDPGVFVDNRVIGVVKTEVTPQIEALSRKVDALLDAVEPTLEDSRIKKAKAILVNKGIDISGFDDYRKSRIEEAERQAGKKYTAAEITAISGERWAIEYSLAVAAGRVKPKVKIVEPELEKISVRRKATVTTVGGAGESGGSGYRPGNGSVDQSFQEAQRTGKWASHLGKKGVRPFGSEQGG